MTDLCFSENIKTKIKYMYIEKEWQLFKKGKKQFKDVYEELAEKIKWKKEAETNRKNEVYCLDMHLNMGSLLKGVFSEERKNFVSEVKTDELLGNETLFTEKDWKKAEEMVKKIKYISKKENRIKFWIGENANDICSFLYLLSEIDENCEVSYVHFTSNLASAQDGEFEKYFYDEILLKDDLRKKALKKWKDICKENGCLRTFAEGTIKNVNPDFYDEIILSQIPEEEFTAMNLIFMIQENCSVAVEDYVLKRICMILSGDNFEKRYKPAAQSPLNLYEMIYKKKKD